MTVPVAVETDTWFAVPCRERTPLLAKVTVPGAVEVTVRPVPAERVYAVEERPLSVVVVKGERLEMVMVPVGEETEMPVPEVSERTPMLERVGVPVAEVMARPWVAARDWTPMFAMVMELEVVEIWIADPGVSAMVEVDTPPSWLRMP